jgi:hypothetical protein
VPRKPRLVSGVKGHNLNEISFPGSPVLWAGSFTRWGQEIGENLATDAQFLRFPDTIFSYGRNG